MPVMIQLAGEKQNSSISAEFLVFQQQHNLTELNKNNITILMDLLHYKITN